MDINNLPLETFVEILKRTDGYSVGKCRRVCKQWKEIIDVTSLLWQEFCRKDFKHASTIAKRKVGDDVQWYHIYKNLTMWSTKTSDVDKELREFFKFNEEDTLHALETDYNLLPLRDNRGFVLYEITTLKYLPVAVPEKHCLKISHNTCASAILTKSGLYLQRSVENPAHTSEAFFQADNFILTKDALYFYKDRDVFKCLLTLEKIPLKLILRCDYDIKEMKVSDDIVYIFTRCGKIVTISNDKNLSVKPINIPVEWIQHIKHICALDDKNFICYSRRLFKIETDKYQHLYLDFPPISALFFYSDFVIIGTTTSEILLYRLFCQERNTKPSFEVLATLPDGKYAVHLDICERKTGPLIIIGTHLEIILLDLEFFPHETPGKISFPPNKLAMYKRMLKLRDRLKAKQ
ncbi:uncharacterized protein LOC126378133 [Pectinophora gossypiella]|uniref:uncharacterized protein LOC126378133 n=1 Tax=Pectinophora gossypiella TaxID=13191 RepID=UPI00214EC99C|nr:uncharacterized protein LOC126378133 [Pectinophora gossypiella]